MHIEFLVEEPSAAAALEDLVPKIVGARAQFRMHIFQGKQDLMGKLEERLRGYKRWLPSDWRVVVLVDEDRGDCKTLKRRLEKAALRAGLSTRSKPARDGNFQVVNRLAIEELEAWFFGDVEALVAAYPGIPPTLDRKARYRIPDAIHGGTWETLQSLLQEHGYYEAGLPKIEVARNVAQHMAPDRNQSKSFQCFRDALRELVP